MAITCDYANPTDTSLVNYHLDANSMTVLPATDTLVADWVSAGGVIGPWQAPAAPPTTDQMDTAALNAALTAPGSVMRALGLVVFMEINKLRVKNGDPAYTMAQFIAALKAQIR